jgi:hypothetical protein
MFEYKHQGGKEIQRTRTDLNLLLRSWGLVTFKIIK